MTAIASRMPRTSRRWSAGLIVSIVVVAALFALPSLMSLYWMRVVTGILMLAVVAQGINIMAGFVGYPAFGNVVFFGLGAYGMGISVSTYGQPLAIGLLAGVLASIVLAATIGALLLRLRGHYFAIATLGLNETVSALAANLTTLTGGGTGLSLPLVEGGAAEIAHASYNRFVILFAVSLAAVLVLQVSRFGYGCRAIRANEEAAEAAGVPTLMVKTLAWLVSASLTAMAGGLYARWVGFIEPSVVFDMSISVKAFVMFLIGGAGTLFGPAIGALAIEGITTLAWSHLLKAHLLVLGIIIILVVLVLPGGIQSFVASRWKWVRDSLGHGSVR